MSSNFALPPLDVWATEHLTALITAATQEKFDQAFNNFISKSVKIELDGASLTREEYKQKLQNERVKFEGFARINILNTVQAPKLNTHELQVSHVFTAFRYFKSYQ